MTHKVSIVIPTLNQGKYIEETLTSIISQGIDTQIIVIDGGSTDNTPNVIQKFSKSIDYWVSESDFGQADAINKGARKATGDFIMWLNSDDTLIQGGLNALLSGIINDDAAPFVYGVVLDYQSEEEKYSVIKTELYQKNRLKKRCIISQPGTLIRKAAWDSVNGVDTNLRFAMDYDLWFRLTSRFGAPVFVNKVVAVNKNYPCTKTNKFRFAHYREAFKVAIRSGDLTTVDYGYWLVKFFYSVVYRVVKSKLSNASALVLRI